ncbi:hypothetical protein NDA13_004674 [Ustilago tritici]|nr:hypothetical protein NDA13_004674 [Ustilago tritici]
MKSLLHTLHTMAATRMPALASMHRALLSPAAARRSITTLRPSPRPLLSSSAPTFSHQSPPALVKRTYSTAPNQHQVLQSFGTPLAQFIFTLSRIARIITFTALGVGTIGVVSFEAAHQYVEHFAMPASSPSSPSSPSSSSDEYGWKQLALQESWSGSLSHPGTDPRLGIKGRHAVRSAWMCVNWGGGISPSLLFQGGAAGNSGLGRTAITSMSAAKTLKVDDGMILAMQYLNLAVKIANAKGISLPDAGAIRAGLVSKEVAEEQLKSVDPLAVAFETRLAAVKERQGSRGALESAIGSYEKLYDIATLTGGGGGEKGDRGEKGEKLVRLATKLADLHTALGERKEAERWLGRAVGIAALAGAHTPELQNSSISDSVGVKVEEQGKKGGVRAWFGKSNPTPTPTPALATATMQTTPRTEVEAKPTPALTRALITALLSKSAFHATSASLHEALQTQMSALKLTDAELSRLSFSPSSSTNPPTTTSTSAELHKLWLTHHQSILNLHVAETIYGLTRNSGKSSLPSWSSSKKEGKKGETSLGWIQEATIKAEGVVQELEGERRGEKGGEVELGEKWKKDKQVALVAGRVLRDAKRVLDAASRSRATLEAMV